MSDIQQAPVHAQLADGTTVRIRRAAPRGRAEVLRLYEGMSPEQLLHRLSRMAPDRPQPAEADLNPVLSGSHGVSALDVRVRLEPRQPHDPYQRRPR